MRKLLHAVKVLSVCAVLAISNCSAQVNHHQKIAANVPFDFTVIDEHLSAGKYTLSETPEGTVFIQSEQPGTAISFLAISAQANKAQENSKLVFRRYGDRYFLSEIWCQGTDRGRELRISRVEQEVARNMPKPEQVALLIAGSRQHKPVR